MIFVGGPQRVFSQLFSGGGADDHTAVHEDLRQHQRVVGARCQLVDLARYGIVRL